MTDERKKALEKRFKEIDDYVANKNNPLDPMAEWLEIYKGKEGVADDLTPDELIEMYKDEVSNLVSDGGVIINELETPYMVDGVPFCCVHEMYSASENVYGCNYCEREYAINVSD